MSDFIPPTGPEGEMPLVAIVEDDREQVALLRRYFAGHGVPVAFVAYDGREAVDRFREAEVKPRVIIMDYSMPGANGIDVTRQILAISPDVRVIFLSGKRLDEREALESGAIAVLRKPASLHTIVDAIRAAA